MITKSKDGFTIQVECNSLEEVTQFQYAIIEVLDAAASGDGQDLAYSHYMVSRLLKETLFDPFDIEWKGNKAVVSEDEEFSKLKIENETLLSVIRHIKPGFELNINQKTNGTKKGRDHQTHSGLVEGSA